MNNATPPPPATVFPETADIETSTEDYAKRFAGATGTWMLGVQERICLDLLPPPAEAPAVLDVGGGHGQLARPLADAGYRVTVVGSHPSCSERIRDLVSSGKLEFKTANVVDLPLADRAFDCAIAFRLLTHCRQWQALVHELCRVARRAVVVDYPTRQSLNAVAPMLFGAKKRLERNTRPWRLFRHAEIVEAFRREGWRPDRRKAQFFLPMVLHRAMNARSLSIALEGLFRGAGCTARWGSPVIARMIPVKSSPETE